MPDPSLGIVMEKRLNPPDNPNYELEKLIKQLIQGFPATEVHFGPNPPDNSKDGDLWYHPDENRLYAYVE